MAQKLVARKSTSFVVTIVFFVIALIGGITYQNYVESSDASIIDLVIGRKKITELPYPYTVESESFSLRNNYSCKSLVGSYISADTLGEDKKVVGSLSKGTDTIAIEIDEENNVMTLLTRAGLEMGNATGDEYDIVINNDKHLIAIWNNLKNDTYTKAIDIFMMNKKNGMAVWSKTNSDFFISSTDPSTQGYQLICR